MNAVAIDAEDVAMNRASRERLAKVIEQLRLGDVRLDDEWTAAAVLAHLAFWDRVAAARIEKYLHRGRGMEFFNDVFFDYINESALPQWRRIPLEIAAADATDAASKTDAMLEALSAEDVGKLRAVGRPDLFRRYPHRTQHLDQLERALA
jgi:hypothetical protein